MSEESVSKDGKEGPKRKKRTGLRVTIVKGVTNKK